MSDMPSVTLRFYRTTRNLKQQTIAAYLSMSQANYSNLENGKTKLSPEVAIQLANFYGVDPSIFLEDELVPPTEKKTTSNFVSAADHQAQVEDEINPLFQRIDHLLNLLADEKEILAAERQQLASVFNKMANHLGIH